MRALLLAVVPASGCQLFNKPPPPPSPPVRQIPEHRQRRLDEIENLHSYIDLEIAKADRGAIDRAQRIQAALSKEWEGSQQDRSKAAALWKDLQEATNHLDKVIDIAARHRCR